MTKWSLKTIKNNNEINFDTYRCSLGQIWPTFLLYKSSKNTKITKFMLLRTKNTSNIGFLWIIPLINARRHLWNGFRKFLAKIRKTICSYFQKLSKKHVFFVKMTIFWKFLMKKFPNFEGFYEEHYSYTL